MKKLIYLFVASAAICIASCGNKTVSVESSDSVVTDTVVTDTVVDTLNVDTVAE